MMVRALGIAKTVFSLFAIELLVPGGTLLVLTILLTRRPDSPMAQAMLRRCPALARALPRLTGRWSFGASAVSRG